MCIPQREVPLDETPYSPPDAFDRVLRAEHGAIAKRTKRKTSGAWTGVALSGGGIRSASFCLGALQAMAEAGWLSKFDYLSTVSGGGYIGAGLQWLLHRDAQEQPGGKDFPYGLDSQLRIQPRTGRQTNLQYLRWHANYLLPGGGLTIFSAVAVVLRTAFLSLAIWLPVLILFFLFFQHLAAQPQVMCRFGSLPPAMLIPVDVIPGSWRVPTPNVCAQWERGESIDEAFWPDQLGMLSPVYALCIYIACICAAGLVLLSLAVAFVSITRFPQSTKRSFVIQAIGFGILGAIGIAVSIFLIGELATREKPQLNEMAAAVLLLTVGLAAMLPLVNLLGLLIFRSLYKNAEYFLRRSFEIIGGKLLQVFIYSAILGSIPIIANYALRSDWVSRVGGAIAGGSGFVAVVLGHLLQSRRLAFGPLGQTLTGLLAFIFLYGVLIIAFWLNSKLYNPDVPYFFKLLFAGVVTMALVFGSLSNSNSIGLHRFYRDRLMELFMPSKHSVERGAPSASYAADRLSVTQLWSGPAKTLELFPIINCHAILVNDSDPVLARRGGANFTITPLHIGSAVHGWEECASYERKNREMSLATAIAASGAAANANAAYVGAGVTRNRAVSLVLMLLNVRLGVWIRRPSRSSSGNFLKPTPFFPTLWYGILSRGYTAKSDFVEISDGGHFENLGIYELVRRKADLIIAFDGEADPDTALPALVSLTRRLEEDFGATLDFGAGLDTIMPKEPARARYPKEAKYADLPYARGTIKYADDPNKVSTLIYVKATLLDDMPFSARGYRAKNPDFPNESTADQFYSPEQLDAYRELGRACAVRAITMHKDVMQTLSTSAQVPAANAADAH